MPPQVRTGLIALGIGAGYYACIAMGVLVRFSPDGAAIVWPARAFLVSVLLLLPPRQWWLLVAVIPAHYLASTGFRPDASFLVSATQFAGHAGVALAGALAIRRLVPSGRLFDSTSAILKFILVVGIAVPAAVNLTILSLQLAIGWIDDLWQTWSHWMGAGFFVTITIPPLLVQVAHGSITSRSRPSPALWAEISLVAVLLFTVSFVTFGGYVDAVEWPAAYLAPLPLLLWAATRFGVGGTALALLAMAAGIIVQTIRHAGPFGGPSPMPDVVSLQVFLAATSAPLMLLAALMDERRRTAELLRQFEAGMQVAASSTDTGLWRWDAATSRLWLTDNCRAMLRLPDDDSLTPSDFLHVVHPEDQRVFGDALAKALAGEQIPVLEFRLLANGSARWFVLQSRTECDDAGRPISVSGVFRDISDRIEARLAVERLEERLATLQDDARRRMAQELHDSTAQHLVGAKLNLLTLRERVSEEWRPVVDEAYRSLGEATAEIRTFSYLLHTAQVDEEGLCAMLQRYVPGFERRTGLPTSLRLTERADELSGELQHALLRITQESLGNVQRHAGGTRAAVDVRCIADVVHLVVRDDGKGMGPEQASRLAERLRLEVGIPELTVRIRPSCCHDAGQCRGKGTTIHVSLPLRATGSPRARGIATIARETLGAGRG